MIAKMPLEHFLIIDIETVSEKKDFTLLDTDWQILWQEKVQKIVPENSTVEIFYEQRAAVMAEFAKIVCISIGYFNTQKELQFRVKSIAGHNEKEILQHFIATVTQLETIHKKWCFTGHNIKEFDIPFICRRLLVNDLTIPAYLDFQNMKPWETNLIDTFQYWRFGDYKNYTSLKLLAASLQIPSPKDDIDGSMVGKIYWEEADINRIATYCQKDVATVANIILKFKNKPLLAANQIVFVK